MASNKLQRINEDIRLALSELLRSVKDPRVQQGLVTVTACEATGDLKFCKVYLSVLGDYDEKQMKRGLRSVSGWLRHELGTTLDLRYTPELTFVMDDSIAHGAYINRLINDLDIKHDDESESE